jgi:hypothetical protein
MKACLTPIAILRRCVSPHLRRISLAIGSSDHLNECRLSGFRPTQWRSSGYIRSGSSLTMSPNEFKYLVCQSMSHFRYGDMLALAHKLLYVCLDNRCNAAFLQHVLRASMWTHVDQMATEPHVQLVQTITALPQVCHYLCIFARVASERREDCTSWALVGLSGGCVRGHGQLEGLKLGAV